jgi:hypothetical protein
LKLNWDVLGGGFLRCFCAVEMREVGIVGELIELEDKEIGGA